MAARMPAPPTPPPPASGLAGVGATAAARPAPPDVPVLPGQRAPAAGAAEAAPAALPAAMAREAPAWVYAAAAALAGLACAALVEALGARLHDPDSRLYAAMAEDLAARPVAAWSTPDWGGHWGRQGRFFEHPHGHLWLAAALVRAGLGGAAAVCAINSAALLGGLLVLWGLGRRLASPAVARLAVGLWMVSPAFLQYLVRGNQEHPLALCVLAALWALAAARGAAAQATVWGLALAAAWAIKGVSALALLPVAALFHLTAPGHAAAAGALCVGTLGALAAAGGLEAWTRWTSGEGLWPTYLRAQVGHSLGGFHPLTKLDNLVYYACRPLWFALPAVAACARAWPTLRHRPAPGRWPPAARLGAVCTAVFVLGFALADRKAERYIFPTLPLIALWGAAWWEAAQPPAGRRWAAATTTWRWPVAAAAWVVLATAAKLWWSAHLYREVRLWPGA